MIDIYSTGNRYDPNVEAANLPPASRRKQGYGPLVKESFADAAARVLKNVDPERMNKLFGGP